MKEYLHYYSVVSLEEDGLLVFYLYNAETDELIPFSAVEPIPNPDPDPDPEPDPDPPFVFDLAAYVINDDTLKVVSDRFEILEAQTDGDYMAFHIKTLKDKMSMQGGVFFVVPLNLTIVPQTTVSKAVTITSPRKLDMTPEEAIVRWERTPLGKYGLIFEINGEELSGSAVSSDDDPWNWHYGFEIHGSILLI